MVQFSSDFRATKQCCWGKTRNLSLWKLLIYVDCTVCIHGVNSMELSQSSWIIPFKLKPASNFVCACCYGAHPKDAARKRIYYNQKQKQWQAAPTNWTRFFLCKNCVSECFPKTVSVSPACLLSTNDWASDV